MSLLKFRFFKDIPVIIYAEEEHRVDFLLHPWKSGGLDIKGCLGFAMWRVSF
jgi:hypothetical protein